MTRALIICAGIEQPARLAFDGPDYFETLAEYPTFEAALAALKSSEIVLAQLQQKEAV